MSCVNYKNVQYVLNNFNTLENSMLSNEACKFKQYFEDDYVYLDNTMFLSTLLTNHNIFLLKQKQIHKRYDLPIVLSDALLNYIDSHKNILFLINFSGRIINIDFRPNLFVVPFSFPCEAEHIERYQLNKVFFERLIWFLQSGLNNSKEFLKIQTKCHRKHLNIIKEIIKQCYFTMYDQTMSGYVFPKRRVELLELFDVSVYEEEIEKLNIEFQDLDYSFYLE